MASRLEYKYRWVWVDETGKAHGTNDEDVANEFAESGETVIDVKTGEDLDGDDVKEETKPSGEDEDEDEDGDPK